jgi:hypothetical protein
MDVVEPYLARNGGPIMLAQIENELWPGEYFPATATSPAGAQWPYTEWCYETALALDAGVPWTMCNGATAIDSINTFNGNDAVTGWFFRQDGYGHDWPNGSHAKQPMMWTEDEMWFAAFDTLSASLTTEGSAVSSASTERDRERQRGTGRAARSSWGSSDSIDAAGTSYLLRTAAVYTALSLPLPLPLSLSLFLSLSLSLSLPLSLPLSVSVLH